MTRLRLGLRLEPAAVELPTAPDESEVPDREFRRYFVSLRDVAQPGSAPEPSGPRGRGQSYMLFRETSEDRRQATAVPCGSGATVVLDP